MSEEIRRLVGENKRLREALIRAERKARASKEALEYLADDEHWCNPNADGADGNPPLIYGHDSIRELARATLRPSEEKLRAEIERYWSDLEEPPHPSEEKGEGPHGK